MPRFDLNEALNSAKQPAGKPRFSLDEALAASGQDDPFTRTKAGMRPATSDTAIPVNPAQPESWQHKAGLVASSVAKGLAGIPDSIIQTPRNLMNVSKAVTSTQAMLLADALRSGLGIGPGAEGMVGYLEKAGWTDTPDNPVPFVDAIPAHPVTSGIDAGLRAVTGTGLAQPETPGERIMDWTIQGAAGGAAMSPWSGIPGLMRGLLNKAHVPPTVLPIGIPAEINTLRNAVLSGAGGGWAGGVVNEATGSPVLGSIAGMGVIPIASAAARSVAASPGIIVTKGGRERNVGELLRQNIDAPESAVGLLREAEGPVFPASPESGAGATVGPTTGQVMAQHGDNRLIGIERALTQSPTPESNALVRRYKSNAEARQAEMERMNPIPAGGGADTVQRAVEREVRRQLALIEDTRQGRESAAIAERDAAIAAREQVKAAETAASEAARADVGGTISSEDAGAVMGAAYDAAYQRQKGATKQAYEADSLGGDINGLPLDVRALSDTIDQYYAGLQKSTPPEVRKALGQIDEAVRANASSDPVAAPTDGGAVGVGRQGNLLDENMISVLQQASPTLTYAQMRTLESSIGEAANRLRIAGDAQTAAVLSNIKHTVRKSMQDGIDSGAVSPKVGADYQNAMAVRRHQGDTFESGAAGQLRRERNGERAVNDRAIPNKLLQSGSEAFSSFQRAIGSEPGVAKTAQDWLATQWRNSIHKPDGGLKAGWRDASAKFVRDHADVLSQYPELQRKLLAAVYRSKSAEDLAARFDMEIKAAEKAADAKVKSAGERAKAGETAVTKETGARFFLRDADPEKAFAAFLKSGSRLVDGRFILQLSRRDPAFRRGVDAAIRDHIAGMKNDAERVRFIEAPANRRLLQSLFGSETLSNWDRVAKDAKRDLLRDTANPARGSDTTPKAEALKKVAGDAVTSPLLAKIMSAINQSIGGRKRDELRAEALTDPKLAADLLEKANNRPGFVDLYKRSAGRAAAGNQDKRKGQ